MVHIFKNNEEKNYYGGTSFIEISYCKLKLNSKIEKIVSIANLKYWQEDSLYISYANITSFLNSYHSIFNNGIYNNLKIGSIDIYGINYYSITATNKIITEIEKLKPLDYQILLAWLKQVKNYNGFYILGL